MSLLFVVLVTERPISKLGEKMIVVVDPVFVRVARVDAMEVVPQSTINHARILHNVCTNLTHIIFALARCALKSRRDRDSEGAWHLLAFELQHARRIRVWGRLGRVL